MLPPILRKGEGLAQVCALPHALDQVLKSMPIVTDFQCTVQFYRDNFEQLHIPRPRDCPHCQASDMFIGHGAYWRKALDRWEDYRIRSSAGCARRVVAPSRSCPASCCATATTYWR